MNYIPAFPKPGQMPKEPPKAVRIFPSGREVCLQNSAGRKEYRRRTLAMFDRQNGVCSWCGIRMAKDDATFDHTIPRGHGGGSRNDAIQDRDGKPINSAMHLACNQDKGSRRKKPNFLDVP